MLTPLQKVKKYSKPNPETGCWDWISGSRCHGGYGTVRTDGKKRLAHRVSYEVFVGPIPEGKIVCHSCDNRMCVNPEHLWIGTQKDNVKDMLDKGRRPSDIKWPDRRGKNNGFYKHGRYTKDAPEIARYQDTAND